MNIAAAVDIVIPVYGQPALVRRCVDSVLRTQPNARIFIVDDCSPGVAVGELLRNYADHSAVCIARTPQNAGFIGATRLGAKLGCAPFVLFLNSDTEALATGWLKRMVPRDEDVAVVGARLVYPGDGPLAGRIQHAGVALNGERIPYHPFLGWPAENPLANQRRFVNAVTGGCMLVRRAVWDAEGGWDDGFGRGVFEDVDFCWRVRARGLRVLYEPGVILSHKEGGGADANGRHPLHEHGEDNLQRLHLKWPAAVTDEHLFFGAETVARWAAAYPLLDTVRRRLMENNALAARQPLERALQIAPDNVRTRLLAGAFYGQLGRLSDAVSQLEAASALAPADWTVRMLLFDHSLAAERVVLAETTLAFMLGLSPGHPELALREVQLEKVRRKLSAKTMVE